MSRDADENAERRPGGEEADGASDWAEGPSTDETAADGARGVAVDLPPVEELTGDVRRLNPRVQVIWIVRGGVAALVLGGVVTGAGIVFEPGLWAGPILSAVAIALGVIHAIAHYRRWRYEVRIDALYLDRGVVTRVKTVVPHVRIQHVDVSRGPVERALGLSSVVVYTAGSRGADVTIPGLPPERANDLQSRLKGLAIAAEGEDAV